MIESTHPSRLMEKLQELGVKVSYNDPYIPVVRLSRGYGQYAGRRLVEVGRDFDLILIATDHYEYRTMDFCPLGMLVVDTRNVVCGDGRIIYSA